MSDLVWRLRTGVIKKEPQFRQMVSPVMVEAADRIEHLEAALREIADTQREQFHNADQHGLWCIDHARALLGGGCNEPNA